MSLAYPDTTLNGNPVTSVRNGGVTIYRLPPGRHTLRMSSNSYWAVGTVEIDFDLSSGERKYYRVTATTENMDIQVPLILSKFSGNYYQVSETMALKEIKSLKVTQ